MPVLYFRALNSGSEELRSKIRYEKQVTIFNLTLSTQFLDLLPSDIHRSAELFYQPNVHRYPNNSTVNLRKLGSKYWLLLYPRHDMCCVSIFQQKHPKIYTKEVKKCPGTHCRRDTTPTTTDKSNFVDRNQY